LKTVGRWTELDITGTEGVVLVAVKVQGEAGRTSTKEGMKTDLKGLQKVVQMLNDG
jgi:hypothetical protein